MRKRRLIENTASNKMTFYILFSWIDKLFPKMVFGSNAYKYSFSFLISRKAFPQQYLAHGKTVCQDGFDRAPIGESHSYWVPEILLHLEGINPRRRTLRDHARHAHGALYTQSIRGIPRYSTIRFGRWHAFHLRKACKIRFVLTRHHLSRSCSNARCRLSPRLWLNHCHGQ